MEAFAGKLARETSCSDSHIAAAQLAASLVNCAAYCVQYLFSTSVFMRYSPVSISMDYVNSGTTLAAGDILCFFLYESLVCAQRDAKPSGRRTPKQAPRDMYSHVIAVTA